MVFLVFLRSFFVHFPGKTRGRISCSTEEPRRSRRVRQAARAHARYLPGKRYTFQQCGLWAAGRPHGMKWVAFGRERERETPSYELKDPLGGVFCSFSPF